VLTNLQKCWEGAGDRENDKKREREDNRRLYRANTQKTIRGRIRALIRRINEQPLSYLCRVRFSPFVCCFLWFVAFTRPISDCSSQTVLGRPNRKHLLPNFSRYLRRLRCFLPKSQAQVNWIELQPNAPIKFLWYERDIDESGAVKAIKEPICLWFCAFVRSPRVDRSCRTERLEARIMSNCQSQSR
jgi:hypothetical protein